MANGVEQAVNLLIVLGIGVFIINLVLALNYSAYAQTKNNLQTQYCVTNTNCVGTGNTLSGVVTNYTTNGGGLTNTYAGNLNLAIFALVFITIIVAVLLGIKTANFGQSGGFLGK